MEVDSIERHLFLEAIYLRYGYDFRQYAEASLDRRFSVMLTQLQMTDTIELLKRALRDPLFFAEILPQLTVNTTSFFRDPLFFNTLRTTIFPILSTYPTISIWLAGCSTGEEAYSLSILLREEGLDQKTTIFATDINPLVLKKASAGIYDLAAVKSFAKNYVEAGGKHSPSDYYTASYGLAKFDSILANNIVFSEHNLATDSSFIEAHLILCRNVLIYFSRDLQDRVMKLFVSSLADNGFLGLGSKENIRFTKSASSFSTVDEQERIYQKHRSKGPS